MQSFAGFPPWSIVYSFGVLFFVFITFLRMLNIENCKKYSLGFNYVQKLTRKKELTNNLKKCLLLEKSNK